MRDAVTHSNEEVASMLPRGWVVLGGALICWVALIGIIMLASKLFSYIGAL
jgi:hypothetical protein